MKEAEPVHALIDAVRQRCHALLLKRVAVATLLGAAVVVLLGSLLWLVRGQSVPPSFPVVVTVMAVFLGLAFYVHGRMDRVRAAELADRHFGLKDGLVSALFLEDSGSESERKLQWSRLAPKLEDCRPETIDEAFPKRRAVLGGVLAGAALWLCLLPPSPAVLAEEKERAEMAERVAEAKKDLEELIEKLDEDIVAAGEKEVLALDEFRKLVKQIDENGDRTEATRQFARIEQKMREAARALDQRRDMETLDMAAVELGKAEETEPRQLGKKLEAKELEDAEEMLKKLAQKKIDPKDLKKDEEGKRKLAEARKDLAKMRATTKRLAAAGKQRQGAAKAGGGAGKAAGGGKGNPGGGEGQMGQGGNGQQQEGLEDLMAELDDAARELKEALEEIEIDPDAEFEDGEFDGPMARFNGKLDQLRGKFRRMNAKQQAMGKLDQLRQGLAQAQGMMQGQQMLGLAQGQGGREAGRGSSWSERQEKDDSQKNGAMTELKGQHGSGPSLSAVEEAESGTGVSGRRGTAKERDFARQVESFVQRDDIPEGLKLGVRNYFENVQSAASKPEDE
ncbi:hypothetical protein ACFQY0_04185 [Haloferula chungangensis]|uniref:DUF4175 domain-containing protein n=1 Tax=Haloferula chungangensis TaxID=1048331 RepID=A0ABW2L5J4_9BACT